MKIAVLLLTWVVVSVAASSTTAAAASTSECGEVGQFATDDYKPATYEPTWEITQAASYTDAPLEGFILRLENFFWDLSQIMDDPYLGSIIYTALVTLSMLLFFTWVCTPCFCCCRLNHSCMCCPCKQACLKCRLPCKSKIAGRIFIIVAFSFFFMSSFFMFVGRNKVGEFVVSVDKSLTTLTTNMNNIVNPLEDAVSESKGISKGLRGVGAGSCNYTVAQAPALIQQQFDTNEVNKPIQDAATAGADQFDQIIESGEGAVKGLRNFTSSTTAQLRSQEELFAKGIYEPYLDPGIIGMTLAFVTIAVLGIMGSFVCTRCMFWSIGLFAFIAITIISLLITVEFIVGVVLSDFCSPSPLVNVASLFKVLIFTEGNSNATGSARRLEGQWGFVDDWKQDFIVQTETFKDIIVQTENFEQPTYEHRRHLLAAEVPAIDQSIDYYLTCGDSPFKEFADESRKSLLQANNQTCKMNNELEDAKKTVTETQGLAEQTDPKQCQADVGTINSSVMGAIEKIVLAFGNMINCRLANEPLAQFLEEGLCTHLATGIFSLYCAQMSACIFLLFALWTMIIAMDNLSDEEEKDTYGIQMA